MSKNNCVDPAHKPHAALAGSNAKLMNYLRLMVNFCDPLSIRTEEEWINYRDAHVLAWGIEPAVKKSDVLGDASDIVKI